MNIHNTMEDIVLKYLDEILEYKKELCKCEQCKLDMVSYALNRVRPMYVVSSRGIIHTENKKKKRIQEEIDVYSTVAEAIEVVSNARRHDIDLKNKNNKYQQIKAIPDYKSKTGNFFNFPQIFGRVIDSKTLLPANDVDISIFYDTGKDLVKMFNELWGNPTKIVKPMEGTYTFWPAPIPAEKDGIQKDFQLNMVVTKKDYEPLRKFFLIRVVSDNFLGKSINKENLFHIEDLYINPVEPESE